MKKNILLFYLLILTVVLTVRQPAFAVEESTFASSICKDALIANLPDQGKDILSGAILIAQRLRPLDPQVTLYHIFLAAMTEVHVDGGPVTYTNFGLLAFLREYNLLDDFQNFLLNNVGLSRDHLNSLFEKRSDGTLILNTDMRPDRNSTSDFSNYTPDTDRLLTAVTQRRGAGIRYFPNDFFLYVLRFDTPIRQFFFDRLTEPSTSLESPFNRSSERWFDDQRRIREIKSMYGVNVLDDSLAKSAEKAIPANPIIAFDFINKKVSLANGYSHHLVTSPSPYFSLPYFLFEIEGRKPFIKVLEQQTVDDFNRFISFKINDTYVYGKIVGFSENEDDDLTEFYNETETETVFDSKSEYQISLIVESLDGQRYTYDFYRTANDNDSFLSRKMEEAPREGDVFDSLMIKLEDVSSSLISKRLFNLYQEIRGLVGTPMPLNQHTTSLSTNLFRGLFNLIALNNYLREHNPELEVKQVSLSDFDEDRHFVSFLNSQDERVPGKLIEVNNYSVTVEDLNGHKNVIEGEVLNTVFQDKSVRLLFQYPHNDSVDTPEIASPLVVQREGEGYSYAQLEMSGDPAQDAFRKALIAGRFEGDERFISLDYGGRKLAKVISWKKNKITLQVYKGSEEINSRVELSLPLFDPRFRFLWDDSRFSTATVSRVAKDYFERIDHFLSRRNIRVPTDEDYQFLSRSAPVVINKESDRRTIEMTIDLTDPSLRKWMRKATDLIKEKTGITPGPQNLTAAQRVQIYRIFHDDIVPLVESPKRGHKEEYSYFRDLLLNIDHLSNQNRFRFLGHVLDTKSAVCAELSAFGAVLFSEYGLHTRYMGTSPQMMEIVEGKNHGHAWIGVQREDGSLEFIDTNSRIFWSTNLRLLRERYPGLSYLSDDKLLSLSEEYTIVTPPSLE